MVYRARFITLLFHLTVLAIAYSCKDDARKEEQKRLSPTLEDIVFEERRGIEYSQSFPRPDQMNANMFRELVQTGKYVVIDLRSRTDYKHGHIPGAVSLPYGAGDFEAALPKLDKQAAYLLYDHDGRTAVMAMVKMKDAGISHVSTLIGGWRAWKSRNFEIHSDE